MSESYSLPTEPEGMVATLVERFNSGKVRAMIGNPIQDTPSIHTWYSARLVQ